MVADIQPSPRPVDPTHAVVPTGLGPKTMPPMMTPGTVVHPMAMRPARMTGDANVAEMMDVGNMTDVTDVTKMTDVTDVTDVTAMVAAPMAAVACQGRARRQSDERAQCERREHRRS
jgi:hypothetical protein